MMDTSVIFTTLSVVLVGLSVYLLDRGAKKANLPIPDYLNAFFIEYFDLLLLLVLIMSFSAEAIIATVLHPKDSYVLAPQARYLNHNAISLLGLICSIMGPKLIIMTMQSSEFLFTKKDSKGIVVQAASPAFFFLMFGLMIVTMGYAIWVPYFNTSIIAKGFGQSKELDYAWHLLTNFWKGDTYKYHLAMKYGFDPNKSVSELFDYNVNNSYVLMLVHIGGGILKGLIASVSTMIHGHKTYVDIYRKRLRGETINSRINSKETQPNNNPGANNPSSGNSNNNSKDPLSDPIDKILAVFKGLSGTRKNEIKDKMLKALPNAGGVTQISTLSGNLNALAKKLDDYKLEKSNGTLTEDEYNTKISDIRYNIISLIVSPEGLNLADLVEELNE